MLAALACSKLTCRKLACLLLLLMPRVGSPCIGSAAVSPDGLSNEYVAYDDFEKSVEGCGAAVSIPRGRLWVIHLACRLASHEPLSLLLTRRYPTSSPTRLRSLTTGKGGSVMDDGFNGILSRDVPK